MYKNNKGKNMLCDRNPMWKGDKVGYSQLHRWVISRKKYTGVCEKCKKTKKCDLSNKGVYNRDLNNWEWLCRKCHMDSDGRLQEFLSNRKSWEKDNQMWRLVKNRPKGELCTHSKLTEDDVREIRKLRSSGKKLRELATKFNVCFQTISLVANRSI